METQEILRQLERATGRFPRAAVEAAVMHREEITPELLRILRESTERAVELDAEGDYMAHLYAMFLLAQFREVRTHPLVIQFASLPGELLHSLCGDFLTMDLGRVLASVCGGDLDGIRSLIENEAVDEWVRGAALGSLVTLVAVGQKSREEIVSYFGQLFRGKLPRQFSQVWNELVSCSADLYPDDLIDDIERAYQEDLVEPGYIGWDDVKEDLALGKDQVLARLTDDSHHRLVEDTVREMQWWACFREDERTRRRSAGPKTVQTEFSTTGGAASPPMKRDTPKTGRNEACPCGSGKKFKKCCGA
jgi:Protein of unknown function (DUF1186)/SEC-C motif